MNPHSLDGLDLLFKEEEVWNTIKQLPSDKVPGCDGFTGRFYKTSWDTIKEDVLKAISAVWGRKFRNFESLNSAYITLLPKKNGADQPKDFKPISLVHNFAKLVTKIMANRLATRLQQLVSTIKVLLSKGDSYKITL